MIYALKIYDTIDKRMILGYTVKDDNEIIDTTKYIVCSSKVFTKICNYNECIDLGIGYLYTNKNVSNIQYLKDLFIDKSLFNKKDMLNTVKASYLHKGRALLNTRLEFGNLALEFYTYLINRDKLQVKGYIITDETEVQVVSEILKTKDKNLNNALQDLLDIRKELDTKATWYKRYKDYELQIKRCSKLEDLEEIFSEYQCYFQG